MDDDHTIHIGTIARQISTWLGIGGALFGILSFCMLLGMWFGPIREIPTQFSTIVSQLSEIKEKTSRAIWRIDELQAKYEAVNSQLSSAMTDQRKLSEDAKKLEVLLAQLTVSVIQKVDFLEWKAEFERRNNLESPPLRKSP
jgi:predicted transcriptional regulator